MHNDLLTKDDLKRYLLADGQKYDTMTKGFFRKLKYILFSTPNSTQYTTYKYVRELRYSEYYLNNSLKYKKSIGAAFKTFMYLLHVYKLRNLSFKTGIQIPPNTFGEGLLIYHYGPIIVNGKARIGKNAKIYPGVLIGSVKDRYPIIGDDCFIGAGSKIYGSVKVGNNVTIAPNSVVTKDVPDNAIVGGIPAKIIKYKNN